ncbi:MAG: hypothetical protein Q9164_000680 [Protoblastenia rupestris]
MKHNFLFLPPELIRLIFSYVEVQSLLSLTRTCKKFHELSLPAVYHDIRWRSCADKLAHKQRLLLRTLQEQPDLGSLIKIVEIVLRKDSDQCKLSSNQDVRQGGVTSEVHWPSSFELAVGNGSIGELTSLLLLQMPNIQTVFLRGRCFRTFRFLSGQPTTALMDPTWPHDRPPNWPPNAHTHVMRQIRRIYIDNSLVDVSLTAKKVVLLQDILKIFHSPKLEAVYVELPSTDQDFQFSSPLLRPENLTCLQIPFSRAPPWVLATLLATSPPLQTLVYHYQTPQGSHPQTVDVVSLSQAIASVSSTLEILTVSVEIDQEIVDNWPERYPSGLCNRYLEGLEHCTRLSCVDVSLMMLAEWHKRGDQRPQLGSKLPSGLVKLRLREVGLGSSDTDICARDILRWVKGWVEAKQIGAFRAWESLEVEREDTWIMWEEDAVADLFSSCTAIGIDAFVGEFEGSIQKDCLARWEQLRP